MDSSITFEQFKEIVSEQLGVDTAKLGRKTSFMDDLGIDSLSLVNFIFKIENKNKIKFKNQEGILVRTMGEAYDVLTDALKEKETV